MKINNCKFSLLLHIIGLLIGILFFSFSARASELLSIPKLTGEIKFDGVVDEPAWQLIEPLPMVMHLPTFGIQPTERSEVMIAYDNEYIYIGPGFLIPNRRK